MTLLCIYHKNCADGLGSAWAVHRRFGADVEFLAAGYEDRAPLKRVQGRDVLIVDFSYKLDVLREMAKVARSVLVLDHHKTAQTDLEELPNIMTSWEDWIKNL